MPASVTSPPPHLTSLRSWQQKALAALEGWEEGHFLVSAAPGAGKTRPSLELAKRMLRSGSTKRVVVLCPTAPLTRQWASAAAALGVQLQPDAERLRPPREFHGVSVTYARVAADPSAWASHVRDDTLVIADEAHHLGDELAWGASFQKAFFAARRWLLLSGTPFRSDATPIPGVSYDADGIAVPDVSYTYAEAVNDGICRPVAFVTFDGTLSWRSGEDVIESSFETVLSGREASRRYRTAISTELPDGLPRILKEAHEKLTALRQGGHRDAGALAIAADATHARKIAKLLAETTGRPPLVVLHTEAKASEKLAAFRASREPWIVAVNMVSEGVDIPRLRVGIYATAAKTPLIFRQIVGRFVRTLPGRLPEPSWLYLPADPLLRAHASEVESELRYALRRTEDEEGFDEREPRRETERGETADFVPLSAEFSPQMTLFGPPAPAPPASSAAAGAGGTAAGGTAAGGAGSHRGAGAMPRTTENGVSGGRPGDGITAGGAVDRASDDVEPPPPALAAFERRDHLRQERSKLVAELQRRDGRSHREINAWLNRAVGIAKVDDATLGQLERSVEKLVKELTKRSGRRA